MKAMTKNKRIHLLTWLVLPLFLMWIAVAYLVGLHHAATASQGSKTRDLSAHAIPEAEQIEPLVWNGEPLVTFWFDDAWKSQYTEGFRILEEYGYTGTIAVPTRLVESDDYMTWPQVRQVHYKGWEITSHTRNHVCTIEPYNNDTFARDELVGSLEDFAIHGLKPSHFVTPCGLNGGKILEYAEKNYLSRRGTGEGINPLPIPDSYLYDLRIQAVKPTTSREDVRRWIAEAKEQNGWLIIMFHQIDDSNAEYSTSPENAEAIVEEVRKAGLQVVLPSQVIGLEVVEEEDNEK